MAGNTISPKRVWAGGLEARRTRNLFPATYERDVAVVGAMLAKNEAQAATARRTLQAALKSGDTIVARSQRSQLDRFETYSRNCRERLYRLAFPVTVADAPVFLMAAE